MGFRLRVLFRDRYRCQKCGSKNGVLVHHILPRRSYPAYENWTENGITLCRKCHSPTIGNEETYVYEFAVITGLPYELLINNTLTIRRRKLIKQGGSYLITLPARFVKENKLKKGDHLTILAGNMLIIYPSEEAYETDKTNAKSFLEDRFTLSEGTQT